MIDDKSWPLDDLQLAARKIHSNADDALINHQIAWQEMREHIASYPTFLQGVLQTIMDKNQQRYRMAYEWQKSFADALLTNTEKIGVEDTKSATEFKNITEEDTPE